MSIQTIRQLSLHQIEQLRGYFVLSEIQNIGVIIETGEIVIEYIPHYQDSASVQTRKISLIDPNFKPTAPLS